MATLSSQTPCDSSTQETSNQFRHWNHWWWPKGDWWWLKGGNRNSQSSATTVSSGVTPILPALSLPDQEIVEYPPWAWPLWAPSKKLPPANSSDRQQGHIQLCLTPILAPIFFGQRPTSFEGSVFDNNFVDKMMSVFCQTLQMVLHDEVILQSAQQERQWHQNNNFLHEQL